jgi:hypothetical protein
MYSQQIQRYFVTDPTIRLKWDNTLRNYEILEIVRENVEVTRLELHAVAGGLISPREFIDLRYFQFGLILH